MFGGKRKRCLAARRLPWPKHAEPKREVKKSNCMLRAREMKAAWLASILASRFPHVRNIKMFVICLFLNPLAEIIWAASLILNREKEWIAVQIIALVSAWSRIGFDRWDCPVPPSSSILSSGQFHVGATDSWSVCLFTCARWMSFPPTPLCLAETRGLQSVVTLLIYKNKLSIFFKIKIFRRTNDK